MPGTPLGRSTPEPEQDVVVTDLLGRLWTQPPDGHPFRPLQAMCEDWATEFEDRFARSAGGIDPGLAREAMTLFRELPRSGAAAAHARRDDRIRRARRGPRRRHAGQPARQRFVSAFRLQSICSSWRSLQTGGPRPPDQIDQAFWMQNAPTDGSITAVCIQTARGERRCAVRRHAARRRSVTGRRPGRVGATRRWLLRRVPACWRWRCSGSGRVCHRRG